MENQPKDQAPTGTQETSEREIYTIQTENGEITFPKYGQVNPDLAKNIVTPILSIDAF